MIWSITLASWQCFETKKLRPCGCAKASFLHHDSSKSLEGTLPWGESFKDVSTYRKPWDLQGRRENSAPDHSHGDGARFDEHFVQMPWIARDCHELPAKCLRLFNVKSGHRSSYDQHLETRSVSQVKPECSGRMQEAQIFHLSHVLRAAQFVCRCTKGSWRLKEECEYWPEIRIELELIEFDKIYW